MVSKKRIASVDILRGMTIVAMILVNTPGSWAHVYAPLLHAEWHGLTPTDLVFPFFLFIVGVSIYYAYKNKPNSILSYKKIAIRSLKLIGLGLFLNAFLPYFPFLKDYSNLRIPGVLQRIGVVFFITSILYLNLNKKALFGLFCFILIAYWLFLGYVPVPIEGGQLPTFDRAPNNWANFIDLKVLGSHMWKPDYDPEGILSTIPAIATCISGVLIGVILDGKNVLGKLILIAFVLLISGYLFSYMFPINKALWSSSFVLVTSGWATLILSIIFYLKDVKNYASGNIFKYIGMNAITVFFLSSFISKVMYLTKVNETDNVHSWLYRTFFVNEFYSLKFGSLLYALAVVSFYTWLAYIMFKKNIFLKV